MKIIEDLKANGALVDYHDPYIKIFPKNRIFFAKMKSKNLNAKMLKSYDSVFICTDHDDINYDLIIKNANQIFDSRNVFKRFSGKVIRV